MKLLKELNESISELPKKFTDGDAFMSFVYDKWPGKSTHVEHQGGGAWMAEIEGGGKIKAASFNEQNKFVSWLDKEHEELKEAAQPTKPQGGHYVKTIGNKLKKIDSVKGKMAYVDNEGKPRLVMPISYFEYVGVENGKHIWKDT